MSLILAAPCAEGLAVASDSRGVSGAGTIDGAPKLTMTGSFALGAAGITHGWHGDETVFDPAAVAARYWEEAEHRLTPASFDAFRDVLLEYARGAPVAFDFGRNRLAFLVASVPEPGVALLGVCRLYGAGGVQIVHEFTRWTGATPWNVRMIGRWAEARSTVTTLAGASQLAGRTVGQVPAARACAFATEVLLRAAAADPLVGGVLSTNLLRAPAPASAEAVTAALTKGVDQP